MEIGRKGVRDKGSAQPAITYLGCGHYVIWDQ